MREGTGSARPVCSFRLGFPVEVSHWVRWAVDVGAAVGQGSWQRRGKSWGEHEGQGLVSFRHTWQNGVTRPEGVSALDPFALLPLVLKLFVRYDELPVLLPGAATAAATQASHLI